MKNIQYIIAKLKYKNIGVVVDVHYVNDLKPCWVAPCWVAHVHYNDTICVYQNFNKPVNQGQVVYRKIRVKTKQ